MLIKTVIIDDEVLSVELLVKMLADLDKLQIVGIAHCLKSGIEAINKYKPDLVFLDINMPGENGFDLLNITDRTFEVIIASGYDYALNAFKANATDYLLKPFDAEDLFQAVEKVRRNLLRHKTATEPRAWPDDSAKIPVPSKNGVALIKVADIIRCEGLVNYTRIHLISGEAIICSKTLLEFEKILTKYNFLRIHKSHLINLNLVQGFTRGNSPYVLMRDNSSLQVSRRNKETLFRRLSIS
jgi:two-component system, LytTR family, response regulator